MRRSVTVTLTLLAGAGLGLAYCNSDPDTEGVLADQSACVDRLGGGAASECADVFAAARATHESTAPRFDSAEACRDATGSDCVALDGGAASVFIPAMAGVLIGRALADGTRGAMPVYAGLPPGCLPPLQPGTACAPAASTGGSTGSGTGRRYWYSGSSFAGSSDGEGRAGFRRTSTSAGGDGMLSRSARSSGGARSGASASRSGGFGFSAAAHAGHGS